MFIFSFALYTFSPFPLRPLLQFGHAQHHELEMYRQKHKKGGDEHHH